MPNDDTPSHAHMTHATDGGAPATESRQEHRSIFRIPAPLKRVFDRYPLITYDENEPPLRAPRTTGKHVLHVFTTAQDAKSRRPSFNPGCLKWQVWTEKLVRWSHRILTGEILGISSLLWPIVSDGTLE